mmetsp:Transcript_14728/g.33664  ORF Transcript_14728/g.33664 Transcript_14728/m.33664 type:complete len:176 (-) Transcript_14728:23-550(-)|eukprot:CAMPEP_0119378946 /NCGR_PEP_ID=MMETSP1334-20130426/50656_1 /TAXON_ID=127549 /ORGANISM="Calcidiscus leptoporus, Strain RCC1130" /LENGTH=175 /DNA_ID=CAMNT_0007398319 /DNA_START=72 /DNA_END=599 /DNA_ORIENTATION=-
MTGEAQRGEPRPGAVLAGCALVGAAAGYALLALRFKNLNMSDRGRFAAGSAEMKAAESITRTFVSSRLGVGGTAQRAQERLRDEERRRAQREANKRAARERAAAAVGEDISLRWATQALELPESISHLKRSQLKDAYRVQAKKFHPDQNKDPAAAAAFQHVGRAYEALSGVLDRS